MEAAVGSWEGPDLTFQPWPYLLTLRLGMRLSGWLPQEGVTGPAIPWEMQDFPPTSWVPAPLPLVTPEDWSPPLTQSPGKAGGCFSRRAELLPASRARLRAPRGSVMVLRRMNWFTQHRESSPLPCLRGHTHALGISLPIPQPEGTGHPHDLLRASVWPLHWVWRPDI